MISNYKDLTVWKKSMQLVKEVYNSTKKLPKEEMYVLNTQMRRSAISVPSNIAEGYKRRSRGEYLQFLGIANASVSELETQILIAESLYPTVNFNEAKEITIEIQKMLTVMIRRLNPKPSPLNPLP